MAKQSVAKVRLNQREQRPLESVAVFGGGFFVTHELFQCGVETQDNGSATTRDAPGGYTLRSALDDFRLFAA